MQFLGLEIRRRRAQDAIVPATTFPVTSSSTVGWLPLFHNLFQRSDRPIGQETLLAYFAVYACISLIAGDIAKMCLNLVEEQPDGTRDIVQSAAFSPVLRKPNRYQTRVKFFEWWITSKLIHGNTYALKVRDARGVVTALYVLDPQRVTVLVAPDGSVFYQLAADQMSGLTEAVTVPAREIIHDIMCALYHPLCGVSPITACALATSQGLKIQHQSQRFFQNGSQLGGILMAPGPISDAQAKRIKDQWEANYAGEQNIGKLAVLGDGLKYEAMMMTARDAQLIDQLRFTAEIVCACFHVPMHKVLGSQLPNYNNIEALDQQYYSQCLQTLIEAGESVIDEGLGLGAQFGNNYGVEFELEDLMRMDSATKMTHATAGVKGGVYTPNDARLMFNRKPLKGGNTVYLQDQDHAIEWLYRRDQTIPAPPPAPMPATPSPQPATRALSLAERKALIVGHTLQRMADAA